jgi:hypothetical protein
MNIHITGLPFLARNLKVQPRELKGYSTPFSFVEGRRYPTPFPSLEGRGLRGG